MGISPVTLQNSEMVSTEVHMSRVCYTCSYPSSNRETIPTVEHAQSTHTRTHTYTYTQKIYEIENYQLEHYQVDFTRS